MYKPKKTILTAGPSITKKEISYVTDAVTNGWNRHYADYVKKFEKKFAEYIGVKYSLVTSGGTGALHLGLASLGIGPGDEVILPELTYFACSNVVLLLGAKPVFVDILKDTWCIDPDKIESAITKRTKAVMPVHIYGSIAEVEKVKNIAQKHNLKIIEDACPSVGSIAKNGKKPGSFGDCAAFSFQGAKIMVTGWGGMFVTNDRQIYEKARVYNNHGEISGGKKFWQSQMGYSSEMSNIQAALGLAQLERIETFVNKKTRIFHWYEKRLTDIEGLRLNAIKSDERSNFTMTSIVLDKDFGISRDEVITRLKKLKVDSRPFFYPISMFPIHKQVDTPVAHHVCLNGINLPSGLKLNEYEVDYICRAIRKVLKQ